MPAVISTSEHDVSFHHDVDDIYPSLQAFDDVRERYPYTKTPNQKSVRQHNDIYYDTWGVTGGEILTFFRGSTERALTEFPLSTHLKPSGDVSKLPVYLQQWLATDDGDDGDSLPASAEDQDSMVSDSDYGSCALQDGHDSPVEFNYATHIPFTAGEPVDQGEFYEEAAMSFTSEYLNLDYEISTFANHTAEAGFSSSPTSSFSSPSLTSTAEDGEAWWEIEHTSLSLLDTTKFEIEVGANGAQVRNPWPWGDYTYRSPSPPRYHEPEDYVREGQLAWIKENLRVQLSESFAEAAIRGGGKERRGENQKAKEVGRETSTPIVAFSQVIRGRTIYNP